MVSLPLDCSLNLIRAGIRMRCAHE
jgi:hypothetical protein